MNRRRLSFIVFVALHIHCAMCLALRKSNRSGPSSSEEMVHQAALALPPNLSPLSRILTGNVAAAAAAAGQPARVKVENYKAMVGETVRFECPQPNPTWFFRRVNNDDANRAKNGVAAAVEELIVTRFGVINAEYKYKIMCHSTLKHKVIIINNVEFDDEGLYTCLYTQQPQNADVVMSAASEAGGGGGANNMAQFRYVFNLTVYSKSAGQALLSFPRHFNALFVCCSAHQRFGHDHQAHHHAASRPRQTGAGQKERPVRRRL